MRRCEHLKEVVENNQQVLFLTVIHVTIFINVIILTQITVHNLVTALVMLNNVAGYSTLYWTATVVASD